jgi:hypothetical protein
MFKDVKMQKTWADRRLLCLFHCSEDSNAPQAGQLKEEQLNTVT